MMKDTAIMILAALLGPVIGSAAGVLLPAREALLDQMLAFAGGTMLTISFLELVPESILQSSVAGCAAGLMVGVFAMLALHQFLPEVPVGKGTPSRARKKQTALLMLAAITLHNLPEGIAMAAGGESRTMLLIAVAIAMHDIPEGICTAAPYYFATGNRGRAFLLSASTALPTLLGFALGRYLLRRIPLFSMGILTGAIAGLMIAISCEELIPDDRGGSRAKAMPALVAGIIFVLILRGVMQP